MSCTFNVKANALPFSTLRELLKESKDAEEFLKKETLDVISGIVDDSSDDEDKILMPPPKKEQFSDIVGLGLKGTIQVEIMDVFL